MATATVCCYCPTCSATVKRSTTEYLAAVEAAQRHARITGHVVNIVDDASWRVAESVSGEPGLPLW